MITSATRWLPLPGPLGKSWEGSDTGLVRRTAAPAGYEGFIGRLSLPHYGKRQARYSLKAKGVTRQLCVSVPQVLALHGIKDPVGPDWLERARNFVAEYNDRLDRGEEVERGGVDVPDLQGDLAGSAGADQVDAGAGAAPVPGVRGADGACALPGGAVLDSEGIAENGVGAAADPAADPGGPQATGEGPGAEDPAGDVADSGLLMGQDPADVLPFEDDLAEPPLWKAEQGFEERQPDFGLGF
jgi:hypothetical protein